MNLLLWIVIFVIGIAVGIAVTLYRLHLKSVGILRCNTTDPDGPYLFLEPTMDMNTILKKDFVIFEVRIQRVSHK